MRPQAHVASGLLVWSALRRPVHEAPAYVLAANLPDLDRPVAARLGVQGRRHHVWPSHSFVFWVPLTVLGRRRPSLVACVWIHLVLDTYADGIAWLWPAYREKLGLFRKPATVVDDGWDTPRWGWLEPAMWLATAALTALRRR